MRKHQNWLKNDKNHLCQRWRAGKMVGKKVPDSDLDFVGERAGRSVEFHCQGRKRKEARRPIRSAEIYEWLIQLLPCGNLSTNKSSVHHKRIGAEHFQLPDCGATNPLPLILGDVVAWGKSLVMRVLFQVFLLGFLAIWLFSEDLRIRSYQVKQTISIDQQGHHRKLHVKEILNL